MSSSAGPSEFGTMIVIPSVDEAVLAFATTALAFIVGSVLGIWSAVVGGWPEQALSRFVDAIMAIPALIFSLLLLTIFGTSVLTLILVIAAVDATRVYRLARSVAQGTGGPGRRAWPARG